MDYLEVAKAFVMEGEPVACVPLNAGHINQTCRITTDRGQKYVLQCINQYVFHDPVAVMENATAVTDFIRQKGGSALHFLRDRRGAACHRDERGEYWRAYEYVPGRCLDGADSALDMYQSGLAFGQFQQQLLDYPAATLHETIPGFHDTPHRFRQLKEAIARAQAGRLHTCRGEVERLLSREALGGELLAMYKAGTLPLRVTHNDAKLNNVLLDPDTRRPLCVLDLDTVMPGLSSWDFGDAIRFGACTAAEDEPDPGKMKLDMAFFEAFTQGFLEGAPALTAAEKEVLPLGAITMTLESGVRFLADYLNGDTYFRAAYPDHNLVRARTQLALCEDMCQRRAEMSAVVEKYL